MTRWHLSKPVTLSPIFGGGKGWEQDELYDIYQFFNRASTCRIFKIYSTGTSGLVLIRVQMKMFHLLTLANGIRVGLRGWGDVPTPSPLKGSWIFLQGKTEIPVPAGWIKEKSNLGLPNHKYYLLVLSNSILDTLGIYPLSHKCFLQGVVIK